MLGAHPQCPDTTLCRIIITKQWTEPVSGAPEGNVYDNVGMVISPTVYASYECGSCNAKWTISHLAGNETLTTDVQPESKAKAKKAWPHV
jgi:hypothetical protein